MHIPDGFISPKLYLPLYAVSSGFWAWGLRRLKENLNEETIPFVASLTAFCFVAMMITIPLPGGTTAHASAIGLLAVLFGIWTAFISVSLVLLIQALFFGNGGITSLPVNAFGMGLIGSVTAWYSFKILSKWNKTVALFIAGWLSVTVSALVIAFILGIQPIIAHSADGTPLFFPFGLSITLPSVVIPHLFFGVGEGVMTVIVYRFLEKNFKGITLQSGH